MPDAVTVRMLMHTPPVTVGPQDSLAETVRVLNENRVGAAAVLDGGRLVGMVSERDVLHAVGEGIDPHTTSVDGLMTRDPVTVQASLPASEALGVFTTHRFRHLPVIDGDRVVGILSIRHIVRVAQIQEVRPAGSAGQLAPAGLEGVAVAETAVGDVRGEEGFYHYRGYDATELARNCSFEEVWHLLLRGELPDAAELRDFTSTVAALRRVPAEVDAVLHDIARVPHYTPLRALAAAVPVMAGALDMQPTLDLTPEQVQDNCLEMAAIVPVLLMRLQAYAQGRQPVDPDADLGYAAAYLQMVTGTRPSPEAARALEQYLILTMDHGFNSSTFTARVVTSTGSDVGSAVAGAIGALAGPLHGGAPSRALAMLDAIGTPDRAEAYLRREVGAGHKLMGFGHRVYKTDDPRSLLLREVATNLGGPLAEFGKLVEATALAVLHEMKPGRKLYTNVEFYAGVVMHSVGLPRDMFTPTFACSRTVGWTAGIAEQAAHNRLIRPQALYVGPPAPRPLPAEFQRAGSSQGSAATAPA
ncbi:MAG: citrate synthase [Candidatus Dormibacteria bacterium]